MQRNRGNFNWAGNRSSLTREEKMMVEQQQEMIRIMSIKQSLASLPTQPHVSLPSFPLLTPMGNILQARQMSTLVAAGMMPRPAALFPTPSMVIPSAIPPTTPSMVPPPVAQFSGLSSDFQSQRNAGNNLKSSFFSSQSGGRDERGDMNTRFDGKRDTNKKWDDRRWNLSEQRNEEDRASRFKQDERSWSKRSQEDNSMERGGSSKDWPNLSEDRKSVINPWAGDERRTERSGEWNRDNSERPRESDRSWNFKPHESQNENRNIARSCLDDKRNRMTDMDAHFDQERKKREPERTKEHEEQRWISKDNRFEDKMWGQERQRATDDSRSYGTKEHMWSKEAKGVNSWSVKGLKEEKKMTNQFSSAEEDVRVKRPIEEEGYSLHKQPKLSGEGWFSNSKQSEEDVWTKDHRKSEGQSWNSKSTGSKDAWSKTSNENRDVSWTNRLEVAKEDSWKAKSKDIWSDKSKGSGQESFTRKPMTTGDSKKSSSWADRPRNEDQPSTSRNDDGGSKWIEKPNDLTEQNWQRKNIDTNEYRGISNRENEGQTSMHSEKLTRPIELCQNKWTIDREPKEKIEPPSNFLYPDPGQKHSSDVWSRLSSITTEDRSECLETLRAEESREHQIIRGDWGDDWEGDMMLNRNIAAEETSLALKVGYLDSQLERLDHRMMQLHNISSIPSLMPQNEELLPSIWENQRSSEVWPSHNENMSSLPSTTDLRITLQKKAEAGNVGGVANSRLGGWTNDMVLIYPFIKHSHLSGSDISELKTLLSQRIHNLLTEGNPEDIQPRFLGAGPVCNGWFMVHCGDDQSLEWLLKWKPTLVTKKMMNLCVRKAVDAVRVTHIEIYFKGVKDSVKDIESRLHSQNEHLETLMWRRGNFTVTRSGITLGFLLDYACLKLLEANGWRLYYELCKVRATVVDHSAVPRLMINKKRRN